MGLCDRVIEIAMTILLIIGGYQFYFFSQRRTWPAARFLPVTLDPWVSYDPRWVWVYSGLYYPMIALAALAAPDWRAFALNTGCFIVLLAVQMQFFLWLPTAVPQDWRDRSRAQWLATRGLCRSQRFLDFVWSYDKLRNSMPSMHVSMATMTDLTIAQHWPAAAYVGWLFPVLIAISAVKTKQHYLLDIVPGAALAAAVFYAWHALVA
jgi:membrane-associated phospholipid phosphatase